MVRTPVAENTSMTFSGAVRCGTRRKRENQV
jgi:hypothetical protein